MRRLLFSILGAAGLGLCLGCQTPQSHTDRSLAGNSMAVAMAAACLLGIIEMQGR